MSKEAPVSQEGYIKLLRLLAGDVQSGHSECDATTWVLDERDAKLEVLELKVLLLTHESRNVGKMQR